MNEKEQEKEKDIKQDTSSQKETENKEKKKNISPSQREGVSKESSSTENLGPEDLIASLLEEADLPEEEPSQKEISTEKKDTPLEKDSSKKKRKGFKIFLFTLGMMLILGGLSSGFYVLYLLWNNVSMGDLFPKTFKKNKISSPPTFTYNSSAPLVTSPIGVELRKMLTLDNFLIPYQRQTGEYVFIKVKVHLYFAKEKDYRQVNKKEFIWREAIYGILKNVPLYVWESKKGNEIVRKELKSYLDKKKIDGITPLEVEVNGYILK